MNNLTSYDLPEWAYAFGNPSVSGVIKSAPEDFEVIENLGFNLTGQGEHLFFYITKINCNTMDVVQALARYFKVSLNDVGYSGLKDKFAVTSQWVSVWLPGYKDEPDLGDIEHFCLQFPEIEKYGADVSITQWSRHSKKLKRGVHATNSFKIKVSQINGELSDIYSRFDSAVKYGVPNYFGPQRFGNFGMNLIRAQDLFTGNLRTKNKKLQGIYISAARSLLFNELVSERVEQGTWNKALADDTFIFETSNALFKDNTESAELQQRVDEGEIHPTSMLWGQKSEPLSEREQRVAQKYPLFAGGLLGKGLKEERRSVRLLLRNPTIGEIDSKTVTIGFTLTRGAFATSVLREICNCTLPDK